VGAAAFYVLGRTVGERRLRALVRRYGCWALVDEGDVDKTQAWFKRHGSAAVLIGRLVPTVRSYVSIPAGMAEMPPLLFVVLTAIGSGLWNAALVAVGWFLGERWDQVGRYMEPAGNLVLLALLASTVWFAWKRLRRRGAPAEEPSS
jgi:membrane protein DedA with SNARE-associated domain